MCRYYFLVFILNFTLYSSEIAQPAYKTITYCVECSEAYINSKQNRINSEIEDFKVYFDYNKLYYRKLNFKKNFYPYYIEILLDSKLQSLESSEKEQVYRELSERELKNKVKSKKMKYYVDQ